MTDRAEIIVSGFLCLFFTAFVVAATSYSAEARLLPLVAGIPAWVLSILQLLQDIRRAFAESVPRASVAAYTPSIRMLLWFAGAVLATLALGVLPAAWLFVLFYLRLQFGARWMFALLAASGFATSLYLLVSVLLDIQLMDSVIMELIRI